MPQEPERLRAQVEGEVPSAWYLDMKRERDALLAEVVALNSQVERLAGERDALLRQRWSHENRAEVAERGHKAALARDFEQRDQIKDLRAECERLAGRVAALTEVLRERHALPVGVWNGLGNDEEQHDKIDEVYRRVHAVLADVGGSEPRARDPLPGRYCDGHYDTCASRAGAVCDCPGSPE